jgi:hypothetical protein
MKTLCIVFLVAAAGGISARAQGYTTPVKVNSLSCTDGFGDGCPGGWLEDDFYEWYAESDGTCIDSSSPPIYTYPSPVAFVENPDGWYAFVATSMTSVANGGLGGIDSVDSQVSATIEEYYSVSAEKQIDCEYDLLVDNTPAYLMPF